ncbi:COG1470 family protein [Streptomyces sp. NPDC002104]
MPVLHAPRRSGGLLLATLAAAVAVLPCAVAAPAAADGPGWTAEPVAGSARAAAESGARPSFARPFFYAAGTSGTVLEDRLALVNTSDQEHTITLRGADAYNTAAGAFAVRSARESTGAGLWISFGAGTTVKVPAHTRAVVPFTVTVPPGSPPGDHPAAVVAGESGREVGVRVHLRVGGPAVAALTVEDVSVRGKGAAARVAYTLVNRGNVALAPELAISAEGALGKVAGRSVRALPVEVLPGQRVELTEPWPGAPVFDRVALTLTVTAPGGARATGSASVWCVPWGIAGATGLGLLGLGAVTAGALLLVRKRRVRSGRFGPGSGPAPHASAVPEEAPAPEHELTGAPR